MKKMFKRLLLGVTGIMLFFTPSFAAESKNVTDSGTSTVPMYLKAETTSIDFTINEKITAEIETERTLLDIDQLVIKNLGSMGQLSIDGLSVVPEEGWTVVSDDSDFLNMEKNAKKFSITANDVDLSKTTTFEHGTYLVQNGKSLGISLSGHIGIQTQEINDTKFASLVVTVAIY